MHSHLKFKAFLNIISMRILIDFFQSGIFGGMIVWLFVTLQYINKCNYNKWYQEGRDMRQHKTSHNISRHLKTWSIPTCLSKHFIYGIMYYKLQS